MEVAYIILSVLLAGSFLILYDLPVVGGSILASGAGERMGVRILLPALLLAGILVPCFVPEVGYPVTKGLSIPADGVDALSVGIATAATAVMVGTFSRYPAVPYAFIASLAGIGVAQGIPLQPAAFRYVLSWITGPVVCALLAAGIYSICSSFLRRGKTHMAIQEGKVLFASSLVSLILLFAVAFNNSMVFSFLPSGKGWLTIAVAAGCPLAAWFAVRSKVLANKYSVADNDLDINSLSILSLMLAMTLAFGLFSSGLPAKVGLVATPLPAGTLYLAALLGISMVRERALVDGGELLKGGVAALVSPVLGFLVAYCMGLILDGRVVSTLVFLGILLFLGVISYYRHLQDSLALQRQALLSGEQRAYSTQKSLSALEVRAEMTEQDLRNKLDAKRKELVDFAVGVSDQKEFMEKIYDDLAEVRAMEDGEGKDDAMDSLLGALRERMYFTREMNDFYARSEVLNEDFNMRLKSMFPNLTEGERKLANLLRQGFSSKYIASLMNITPKSVEINRSRLRAKLGLQRSDNLIKIIKSI